MAPVKPTPEYNLAVVPYRPYRVLLRVLLGAVLSVLLALATYYAGLYRGTSTEQSAIAERDYLRKLYNDKSAKVIDLEQKVANFELGSQVDRRAMEQVGEQIVELKDRIAELERDNTFYRDLMRPDNDEQGISINTPIITPFEESNRYDYKMVVKQLNSNRSQVGGYLEFVIVGRQEDAQKRIPLKELSSTVDTDRIKLNFRYFQRIEGTLILPEGFVPEGIELKIVSIRPKKALIEKQFEWLIKES